MADEILKVDENSRWVLGGVTNDGNEFIRNARVNPITGALIVEANVVSNNTSIGSTIPGGTEGSILFLGVGSTLAEDNTNLFWDDTNNRVGIGNNTPTANLHVTGTARITGSTGTPATIMGRDGSGNVSTITVGAGLSLVAGTLTSSGGGGGYDQIQQDSVNITQRTTLNFINYFLVADGGGTTNVNLDVATLATDPTFLSNLDLANISGQIDLTTQVTGLLPAANIDVVDLANDATFITNLEPNLDLANIGGLLDLTTQVTGVLPVANGGTGAATLTGVLVGNGIAAVTATAISQGDLFYGSAAGVLTALAKNASATRYLSNTGGSNNPAWAQVDLTNGVTGILPLANGGTGSNLSDPGANRLWGWDDTDNSIGFWTLGTGLSYDHTTHTLSSSGVSTFTVNADEAVTTWSTSPMVIDSDLGWTVSAAGFTAFANGWIITANTQADASIAVFGDSNFSGGTPSQNSFSSGTWRVRIKGVIGNASATSATTTTRYYWFGLSTSTSSQVNGDITNVTDRVGIAVYNGAIYFVTANGTNVTATSLAARAADQWDMVIVDYDRTTARIWLNGAASTTTSNVPNSGNVLVTLGGYNNAGSAAGISVIAPTIATQYNA